MSISARDWNGFVPDSPEGPTTETGLQLEVQDLCDELGLLWHHCRDSRKCAGKGGFPDLIIVGIGGVIFAELKGADGDTSAYQDRWLWYLARTQNVAVWRPEDLGSGVIRTALERLIVK